MDIEDYRKLQQRILLSTTGSVPTLAINDDQEQESALAKISRTSHLIERYPTDIEASSSLLVPTECESWAAMKRWFSSHHLFIPQLALTGHCLNQVVIAKKSGSPEEARYWMKLASRLRKGCGALFLFGIDFSPCTAIYCETIRKNMPEAFSGFWIRELQHCFLPALKEFSNVCPANASDQFAQMLRDEWKTADRRYRELHEQSMYRAVPDGVSLARTYRHETGEHHSITETEFQIYDTWFCIDRSDQLTQLEYIFQVCDVIERVVADLASGHRLETCVSNQLLEGAKAAMVVFGQWAGPVRETSAFYPKCFRGE